MAAEQTPRDRRARIERLFHHLAELPAAERLSAGRQACQGDEALLQEALDLLESSDSAERLIASATTIPHGLTRVQNAPDRWIGQQIGPFRIDELIGRGGMGWVYRAHRAADRMTGQMVALKISSNGIRSDTAINQLLSERDTLARLQHPNIARLLDAGITGFDLPWIAMEFVEGRQLDVICDDPATSVADRFGFADQLCVALSFVHRHLVLHRDLKPSNVLVTEDDVVKLLDFGIAKWTGPSAPDSPLTEAGLRPLTLRYASPEHVRGEVLTTAADIYSLGLLLHRMFAGDLPDSGKTVQGLPPTVARDLKEVIGKCLRPEPDQRYATVDEVAADLVNAREGRPVRAYRGNWRYRAGKFAQRHKAGLLASIAILTALACGLAVVARESAIEMREQERAQAGLAREETLAHTLLFDFFDQLKAIPGSTDAQHRTVSEALAYLDKLSHSPAGAGTALEPDLIEAYTDFGNLLGSPYEENLGDAEGAKRTLKQAIDVAKARVAREPGDLEALSELARAEMSLARIFFGAGDPQTAIRFMQPAADASDRIAGNRHATSAQIAQAASTLDALGDVEDLPGAASLNDPAKALAAVDKAEAYDKKGFAEDPGCARCHRGIAVELWKRGVLQEDTDPAASVTSFEAGLAELTRFSPADQQTSRLLRLSTLLRAHLGTAELHLHQPQAALNVMLPAQKIFEDAIARDPVDTRARFDLGALDLDLASASLASGKQAQAAGAYREMLNNCDFLLQRNSANIQWQLMRARGLLGLGRTEILEGSAAGGHELVRQALRIIMPLAEKKDAPVEILDMAAQILVEFSDSMPGGRVLSVQFAERAIGASPAPTTEQYATLNNAKRKLH